MRFYEFKNQPLKETASAGATGAGAVATSMGGGAGFGLSPFMRQPTKRKAKKRK